MLFHSTFSNPPKRPAPHLGLGPTAKRAGLGWLICSAAVLAGCGGGGGQAPQTTDFFAASAPAQRAQPIQVLRDKAQAASTANGVEPTVTQLFDWAENTFPELLPRLPVQPTNQILGPYIYRIYPASDLALGLNTDDNSVLAITQLSSSTPANIPLGVLADYSCQVLPAECHTNLSAYPLAQRAGMLSAVLGKPNRLLVGLGTTTAADIQRQSLTPDIYDQYLNSIGTYGHYSWDKWNDPKGAYVGVVAAAAERVGAVPMFTLYQMATWGDGNIWGLLDREFMAGYWNNVRLMYQQIKLYGKPTLVNLEPDFWGYAQRVTREPSQHFAHVANVNPDCGNLPNTVAGMGDCMVQMARALAPNAYVGFPPSMFGDLVPTELAYMQKVGAGKADFVVMQTLDRDAGCYEAFYGAENAACNRLAGTRFYWDATNAAEPSFTAHLAIARNLHEGLGLPLLWWQTPLGVPSATAGGTRGTFRDNRAQYFLTHAPELVAAGGMGVVFSPGHVTQTNINTDGGQFKRLSAQYLAAPAALP